MLRTITQWSGEALGDGRLVEDAAIAQKRDARLGIGGTLPGGGMGPDKRREPRSRYRVSAALVVLLGVTVVSASTGRPSGSVGLGLLLLAAGLGAWLLPQLIPRRRRIVRRATGVAGLTLAGLGTFVALGPVGFIAFLVVAALGTVPLILESGQRGSVG